MNWKGDSRASARAISNAQARMYDRMKRKKTRRTSAAKPELPGAVCSICRRPVAEVGGHIHACE